ncbi:hypothetical protein GCM10009733_002760 [Nonomuraea maheshkhaliensis]|uniref:Secreted protein n=1 Tax=Nonomuraea maheshkhaliensis TaxID=419590 RepID=A0ABP4QGQ9_9ACTN
MFGFCAVKSLTILSNSPAGSSAPHHWANSSVTLPSEAVSLEVPEPHAVASATVAAAVAAPITRLTRVASTTMTGSSYFEIFPPSAELAVTLAACYGRKQEKNGRKLRSTA